VHRCHTEQADGKRDQEGEAATCSRENRSIRAGTAASHEGFHGRCATPIGARSRPPV
jgi:hypothetical protein